MNQPFFFNYFELLNARLSTDITITYPVSLKSPFGSKSSGKVDGLEDSLV